MKFVIGIPLKFVKKFHCGLEVSNSMSTKYSQEKKKFFGIEVVKKNEKHFMPNTLLSVSVMVLYII